MTGSEMTELELQNAVVEAARLLGYRAFHARPARTSGGWRTPVSYDGSGFVDVVLVGNGRVLWFEFKSERGRLGEDQRAWASALAEAGQDWFCVRPHDWVSGAILDLLRGRKQKKAA